jgi:hypothetical protein
MEERKDEERKDEEMKDEERKDEETKVEEIREGTNGVFIMYFIYCRSSSLRTSM